MRAWLLQISAWASFHAQDLHSFHQLYVLIAVVGVGVEGREPWDNSQFCPLLLLHGPGGHPPLHVASLAHPSSRLYGEVIRASFLCKRHGDNY